VAFRRGLPRKCKALTTEWTPKHEQKGSNRNCNNSQALIADWTIAPEAGPISSNLSWHGTCRQQTIPMKRFVTILALSLSILSACQTVTPRRALSEDARVLDLPIATQQDEFECGLIAITTLCAYWNIELPAAERSRLQQLASTEEGLSGDEVKSTLKRLGFETYLFRGTLDHQATGLMTHVDAKRPVLVMIAPEPTKHHYVLFIGYDEVERNACLLDPMRGRIVVPYEIFESTWSGCNNFTLLATPASHPQPKEPS